MSFQFVIDNAAQISINRKPIVSTTFSRDNTPRTVSRGGYTWTFEVTMPDGPSWEDYRPLITKIEKLDRFTIDTIRLNNPGHSWLSQYQGDQPNPNLTVNVPSIATSSVIITSGVTITSGFIFRAGDFIQLGANERVYTVADDVAWNQTTVPLHRPLINQLAGNTTAIIGPNCEWKVLCVQFPQWRLFARNQVSWDGSFVFQEAGYD